MFAIVVAVGRALLTSSSEITAPTPTITQGGTSYSVVYETDTMSLYWTSWTTTTPSALATACQQAGGSFDG